MTTTEMSQHALRSMSNDQLRDEMKEHLALLKVYGAELQRRPGHRLLGDAITRNVGNMQMLIRNEDW